MSFSDPSEFQDAEQLLHSVFDEKGESCLLFDSAGLLTSWNRRVGKALPELAKEIAIGATYDSLLKALKSIDQARNTQGASEVGSNANNSKLQKNDALEYELTLSGDCWVHLSRVNLNTSGWLLILKDVTKVVKDRKALISKEDKFKRFARLASNWFWELDENLCYVYHSTHNGAMFTTDVSAAVGMSRVDSLNGKVEDNDQLKEHNACLLMHKRVDVILTWNIGGSSKYTYSRVLAEPRFDSHGQFIGYIGCGRDVTAAQEMSAKFEYQANHDFLTGLKNRRALEGHIKSLGATDLSSSDSQFDNSLRHTLIVLDLDRFRLINDDAGRAAGNQFLFQLSGLLDLMVEQSGTVARVGGDSFAICLNQGIEDALIKTDQLLDKISNYTFKWENKRFQICASAGLAEFAPATVCSSELFSNAELACHSAKLLGRNRSEVYCANNQIQAQQSAELATLRVLQSAVDEDRIELYLQAIVAAQSDDEADKYEILLRVVDEHGSIVSPGALIPTAEKYGLMALVDLYVVEKSINVVKEFVDQGLMVSFSVNLSGNSLGSEKTLSKLVELVKRHALPAHSLCFEITETAAINSLDPVVSFISELKQHGCQFSLDDFGSGLSSYGYLESLDVDYIKIDGSFIKKITSEKTSQAIVKSINTLSHERGMKTVAEFVENYEIADSVIAMDIDYLQGYHYGRPSTVADVLELYASP
ncbi:MAG: EAL domain-containing protein, partial [Granulosicoccus sp.]